MAMNDDKKKRANTYRTPLPGYVDDVVPQVSTAPAVRPVAAPAPAPAPAPVVPPAVAQKPYQPGFLPGAKLIPGSTADTIANAVSGFKANYNAKLQTGEQQRLANNLNFIDPANPASMKLAPPSAAVQKPAVAAPKPMPAPMPGASATTANKSPSQSMTLDQANAREVAAQTARRPGVQAGAGAPPAAGAAALRPGDPNTFTGTNGVTRPVPGTMAAASNPVGSVQSQNFGTAAVPQAQASIAGPRSASTYGLSVLDPRANDQAARQATVLRPEASRTIRETNPVSGNVTTIERPGNFQMAVPDGAAYRGADQMAEQYNAREDRDSRAKLLSDLDSQRFALGLAAGNNNRRGRAALAALGDNAQQQAALVSGGAELSAGAVQGRAQRENVLANTGLEQEGQDRRAQLDFQSAQMQDGTERYKADLGAIERPTLRTDANGNLLSVSGTAATNVVGADGKPVREAQTQTTQAGQITPALQFEQIGKELTAELNALEPNAERVAALRAQQQALISGGQQQQAKPDYTTFAARAKAQGSRMTEAQLKAAYANL